MNVIPGEVLSNKTFLYLKPCVRDFPDSLRKKLNRLAVLAIGINDAKHEADQNTKFQDCLFFLVDVNGVYKGEYLSKNGSRRIFGEFRDWIKDKGFYVDDYPFDNLINGHQHMIVLKLPDMHAGIVKRFKNGEYSKMYSSENLERLVPKMVDLIGNDGTKIKAHSGVYGTLAKTPERKFIFEIMLQETFNTNITLEEDDSRELEFPPNLDEEVFNNGWKGNMPF